MSYDYSKLASKTVTLIEKFGAEITKVSVARGAFNPDTGGVTRTETQTTVRGVVEEYKVSEIDGRTVIRGDLKVHITGDFAVSPQDEFILSGVSYNVVGVSHVAPGDTVILTTVQVRR